MQAIAVIDNRDDHVVVWIVSRASAQQAINSNAVTIKRRDDERAEEKLRSLTRNNAIVLTPGSDADGLPQTAAPIEFERLAAFAEEIEEARGHISEALRQMGKRAPTDFKPIPAPPTFVDVATAQQFTLQAANYVNGLWTAWLSTDDKRRRQAALYGARGTAGLPDVFHDQELVELPPGFVEAAAVQMQD